MAGTQFSRQNIGYVLSGDGSDHSYMQTGEFWKYDDVEDTWEELTPHPGISRWAPGSFVIEDTIYFFGGQNRQTGIFEQSMWAFQLVEDPVDTIPLTAINEIASGRTILFPNPANDVIQVMTDQDVYTLEVMDLQGRVLLSSKSSVEMNIADLKPAVYFLRIVGSEELLTERFVKR